MKMVILDNGIAALENDALTNDVLERGICCDGMVRHDIIPLLKPGDHVLDGGAAIGDHTVPYLEAVGESGVVYAFEPNPEFFKCLVHNAPKAQSHCAALWNQECELYLHLAEGNIGASHLEVTRIQAGSENIIGPIKTVALDSMHIPRLDFAKLDLEGTEYFALLGMEDTVRRCRPKLVLEMNPNPTAIYGITHMDIYNLLESWGYDHKPIRNSSEKYCAACDILAWPK